VLALQAQVLKEHQELELLLGMVGRAARAAEAAEVPRRVVSVALAVTALF
jgi:hypothetical protein